jgi:lauroyl/myristoyl acyltransferase
LRACATLDPARGLEWSGRLGRLTGAIPSRANLPHRLQELFADVHPLSSRDARRLARELWCRRAMSRTLALYRRQGRDLAAFVAPETIETLAAIRAWQRPIIVVSWHVGVPHASGPCWGVAGLRALIVRRQMKGVRHQAIDVTTTGDTSHLRAAALWRTVNHLRDGGMVMIAADAKDGERAGAVPCFGRMVQFTRGPFLLARLTGAALIPGVIGWTRPGVQFAFRHGPPIAPERGSGITDLEYETAMAAEAARWIQAHLIARPEDLRTVGMRRFVRGMKIQRAGDAVHDAFRMP